MSPPSFPPAVSQPRRTSKMAIWSLVLGILGMCTILPAIPAVILGIIALVSINNSGGVLGGKGLAIGGLITSALSIIIIPILAAIAVPAFNAARHNAMLNLASVQSKELYWNLLNFAGDHDGRLPQKLEELETIGVDLPARFQGDNPANTLENYKLLTPGRELRSLRPDEVIFQFEYPPPRHGRIEVSADGSIKRVRDTR
jgi:hypothetical protein